MDRTREGLAKLIGNLLGIAKVAMPPKLFAEDPRVKRAKAYLVALEKNRLSIACRTLAQIRWQKSWGRS